MTGFCDCNVCASGLPPKFNVTFNSSNLGGGCCDDYPDTDWILDGVVDTGVYCEYSKTVASDPCDPGSGMTMRMEITKEAGDTYEYAVYFLTRTGSPGWEVIWKASGVSDCMQASVLSVDYSAGSCSWPAITVTPVAENLPDISSRDDVKCLGSFLPILKRCLEAPFVGGPTSCCYPETECGDCEPPDGCECNEHLGQPKRLVSLTECVAELYCPGGRAASDPSSPQDPSCTGGECVAKPNFSRNALSESVEMIRRLQQRMLPPIPGVRLGPARVNISSGNLSLQLFLPDGGAYAPVPILTYNSFNPQSSEFGYGWSGIFNRWIDLATSAELTTGDGAVLKYTDQNASDVFLPPAGIVNSLVENGDNSFTETLPNGFKLNYDAANLQLTTMENVGGEVWTVSYQSGRVAEIEDRFGALTTFSYTTGKISSIKLPDGRTTTFNVNGSGDLIKMTTPEMCEFVMEYDANHLLDVYVDPEGNRTSYTYDNTVTNDSSWYWLESIEQPGAGRYTYSYIDWETSEAVDPAGNTTTVLYDVGRNVSEVINPLGQRTTYVTEAGLVTRFEDPRGKVTSFTYRRNADRTQVLEAIQYPDGGRYTFAFDGDDKVEAIVDQVGNRSTLTWDGDERTGFRDAAGNLWTYVYDSSGRMEAKVNPLSQRQTMLYDSSGNWEAKQNELDERTSYTYENGQRKTITNPLGDVTTLIRDDMNRIVQRIDARGFTTSYTYDLNGRLTKTENPLGEVTTYEYDSRNFLEAATNPAGETTTFAYDSRGNRESVLNAENEETEFIYDAASRLSAVENPLDERTTLGYDAAGNLRSIENPLGQLSTTLYDAANRPETQIDARGNRTTLSYDLFGNRTTVQNPLGDRTTTSYTPLNRLKSVEDALGFRTTTTYDEAARAKTVTDARGFTTTTQYDAAGRVEAVINPLGERTTFAYDAAGQQKSVQNARGYRTTNTYDATGNTRTTMNAIGETTTFTYDGVGRRTNVTQHPDISTDTLYDAAGRVEAVVNPLSFRTTFAYDMARRRTSILDAEGNRTTTIYDNAGRVEATQNALGHRTTLAYDEAGRREALVDANGHRTTFLYDAAGNVTKETDPLGRVTTFSYTKLNQQESKLDARGAIVTLSYDAVGRLKGQHFSDNTRYTFTYDGVGNRTAMADGTGTSDYEYDELNRLEVATDPDDQAITYSYDSVGNRATIIAPHGGRFTYSHDALNRTSKIDDLYGNRTTYTYGYQLGTNNPGVVRKLASGMLVQELTNKAGQPFNVLALKSTGTKIREYDYELDNVGNKTSVSELSGDRVTWSYDDSYRLINEHRSGANAYNTTHSYDPVGNRLYEETDGVRTTFTYDAANQLDTSTASGGTVTTYTYDQAGNLTDEQAGADTTQNTWNVDNRLTKVELPSGSLVTMLYNADGLRVKKEDHSISPPSIKTIWDQQNVLAQGDATDLTSANYYTLNPRLYGDLVTFYRGSVSRDYVFDALSSTAALVNSSQLVTDSYIYKAYGEPVYSVGGTVHPFRWVGRVGYQFDNALNRYYVRARHYDPVTARWLSRDPLGVQINLYRYSKANPTRYIDPSGLIDYCAIAESALSDQKTTCACLLFSAVDSSPFPGWGDNPAIEFLDCLCNIATSIDICCRCGRNSRQCLESGVLTFVDCASIPIGKPLGSLAGCGIGLLISLPIWMLPPLGPFASASFCAAGFGSGLLWGDFIVDLWALYKQLKLSGTNPIDEFRKCFNLFLPPQYRI